MSGKVCCFVMALQMVIWVATTSRHLTPPTTNTLQSVHPLGPAQSPQSSQPTTTTKQQSFKEEEEVGVSDMVSRREWRKIGSSPPSCDHKCYGCYPCEAIQVPSPTTSKRSSHFGIQYTNYEPEGWKCKCGPSFYSP